jgi:hypothetical protein
MPDRSGYRSSVIPILSRQFTWTPLRTLVICSRRRSILQPSSGFGSSSCTFSSFPLLPTEFRHATLAGAWYNTSLPAVVLRRSATQHWRYCHAERGSQYTPSLMVRNDHYRKTIVEIDISLGEPQTFKLERSERNRKLDLHSTLVLV